MRRFQIVVTDQRNDRQLFYVNAKTEEDAITIFRKDYSNNYTITRVIDRGIAKK